MFLYRRRLILAATLSAALVSACGGGGSSAPAPTITSLTAGDTQVVIDWPAEPGVDYWLWYKAGSTIVPGEKTASFKLNIAPPYILTGLTNGTEYAFTINGRTGGGAGGPGSSVVTATPSLAGSSWHTGGTLGSTADIRSVAYGLTNSGATTYSYVAVGDSGTLYKSPAYTSTKALAWEAVTTTGTPLEGATLNGILYALGKYIVVGAGGKVSYGTEISTWTAATSGTTSNLNAIATNSAIVVAVGAGGTIIRSGDGITWTAATSVPAGTGELYGVAYSAKGLWVAVGVNGTLLTSTDGDTWSAATSGTTNKLKSVSAVATTINSVTTYTFVAVGASGTELTSTDGLNWTPQTLGAADLNAVSAATSFVAVGAGGAIYTSTDGVTWTNAASPTGTALYGLIHAANVFTAVGAGGSSVYSY